MVRASVASDRTVAGSGSFCQYRRGPFTIGSRDPLPDEVMNRIIQILFQPDRPLGSLAARASIGAGTPKVLGGRTVSAVHEIAPWGRVFFKRYLHGGLLRRITGGRFLAYGAVRSKEEFAVLEEVRALGVHAPRPLAYVTRGGMLYATWLLMEELPGTINLVDVAMRTPEALTEYMPRVAEQVIRLINARILHVDLHPGNVLVREDGGVFLVDFDKARRVVGDRDEVRELYLRRWRRAVIKHRLSPLLAELLSLHVRSVHAA